MEGPVYAGPDNIGQVLSMLHPPKRVWWGRAEIELCLVEAGEFLMGPSEGENQDCEHAQHRLYLDSYYIGRTPVSQAQYAQFVRETGHRVPFLAVGSARIYNWDEQSRTPPPGKENHPVFGVSWHDALAYCAWAGVMLPSEEEWEKAASWDSGHGRKRLYPWGDEWDESRCNTLEGGVGATTPVGAYPQGASAYGLLDMAGNVWEWTRSPYESYQYDPQDGREDVEARSGFRVVRGGSFYNSRGGARCTYRAWDVPGSLTQGIGFRVVVSPIS